ncbi:MAG: flagellar biosynthesis anti-sigma factor FlgM [Methylococcales bacterium]|nr:flagellar biosynthesis anti-sigma factor FlgM [Methylococcales bacterium]
MTINALSGNTNNIILPIKPRQNDKAEKGIERMAGTLQDSLSMTEVAKAISITVAEASKSVTPINEGRVAEIKHALAANSYTVNAQTIAEKMIRFEQD